MVYLQVYHQGPPMMKAVVRWVEVTGRKSRLLKSPTSLIKSQHLYLKTLTVNDRHSKLIKRDVTFATFVKKLLKLESGALTRHLKSLTPCTEKIRFVQYKEILVSKDGVQKGVEADRAPAVSQKEVVVVEQQAEDQEMVEAHAGVVSVVEAGSQEVLRQVHFTVEVDGTTQEQQVVVDQSQADALAAAAAAGDSLICQAIINSGIALGTEETVVEEASLTTQEMDKDGSDPTDVDQSVIEIQVKEEFEEMEEVRYKPFKCTLCQKEFLTGYLLKKHMEVHVSERRYKCGEEKGSLVRHIRHHTGERPFKCPRCGRGFAEHGTLNRHMRAKGCNKENSNEQQGAVAGEQAAVDSLSTEEVIAEDPHAVLVEFSSVVADTQEYIIKMGNQIMKVVQQIVSQSHSAGGHQIIVRNVGADEEGASISDCGDTITIATPESLTEQVAMTLASAISDGTLLATRGTTEDAEGTVTMVTTEEAVEEEIQMVQQQEEYVITSQEEVEVQTVVV
ncbi:hypothetical protein GOODEAATRI_004192 [Goodea atripinnis]|uniref:C2H2-type domain-containing protein n=1 Tax=Goodea atripinnis TaxID=208336 RepID=A0ABV0NIW4_9TELE